MDIMINTRRGNLLNPHERTLRLQHYYELPAVLSKQPVTHSLLWTKIKNASKLFIENTIKKISCILLPTAEINNCIRSHSVLSSINESALTETPKVDPAQAKWEFPNKKPPSARNYENNKRRKLCCSTHSQTDIIEAPALENFKSEIKPSNKENETCLNDSEERIKRRVIKKVSRKKLEIAKGPELEVIKAEEKKVNKEVIEVEEESKSIKKKVVEGLNAPICHEVKESISEFVSNIKANSVCPTPEIRTPKLPSSINLALPIVHTPADCIQIFPEDAQTTKRLPTHFPSYLNTETTPSLEICRSSTNPMNEFPSKPTSNAPLHATEAPFSSASPNPIPLAKDPNNNPFLNPTLVTPSEIHYEFGRSSATASFPQTAHHPQQNFPPVTFGNPSNLFASSTPFLNQDPPKMTPIIDCDMEICETSNPPINPISLPKAIQSSQNSTLIDSAASSSFNTHRVLPSELISAPSSEKNELPHYAANNFKSLFSNPIINRTPFSSENSMNPEFGQFPANKSSSNPYNSSLFQHTSPQIAQPPSASLLFQAKPASVTHASPNIPVSSAPTNTFFPNLPTQESRGFSLGIITNSGKRK